MNKKICLVGLGYVGLPLAHAFAKKFDVVGFDMSGPIYSDDGHWMWNGTEWIPATQIQNAVPAPCII